MKMISKIILIFVTITNSAHSLPNNLGVVDLKSGAPYTTSTKDKELVVFWATWCPECKEKLKKELIEMNKGDTSVLTVNTDKDDARVKNFVAKENIQLPVLRDPTKALRKQLNLYAVPAWAVYRRAKAGAEWSLTGSGSSFEMAEVKKALGGS